MKLNHRGLLKSPPGFVLAFVERPPSWFPDSPSAIPPTARIVERRVMSNFDAAYSDMIQSNREALKNENQLWAMVLRTGEN